jgi:Tol biopolymer transport system component
MRNVPARAVATVVLAGSVALVGCGASAPVARVANTARTGAVAGRIRSGPPRVGRIAFVNAPAASGVRAPGRFAIQAVRPAGTGLTTIFSRDREIDSPPRWSPDGKRIVFSMNSARGTSASLYLVSAGGTGLQKLTRTRHLRYDSWPAWSPTGRKIAFARCRPKACSIWVKNLRTSAVTRAISSPASDTQPAWSPDGRQLAFASNRSGSFDIWVVTLATGRLRRVTGDPAGDQDPAWSPDGRRIAFASLRTGRWNVFTVRASGGGMTQITSTAPGGVSIGPSWSPDGRWIAFASERNGPFNIFAARAVRGGAVKRITSSKLPRNSESPDWGIQP